MDIADKNKPAVAKLLFYLSVVSVILACIGTLGSDLWLASTQWMLVAVVLAVWGIYIDGGLPKSK